MTFRAPTFNPVRGRPYWLDGLLWFAVLLPSLALSASAMQEDYQPEIISDEAARYAVGRALSGYLPVIAFWVGVILIASSVMLLRQRHSKR